MIRHTVVFKFKSSTDPKGISTFFDAAKKLVEIPGVQNFECLKQISKKNDFEYGLSMEFASKNLYEQYNDHPDHTKFVEQYWMNFIEDFMEVDYEILN